MKSGLGVRILKYADAMERWLAVAILAAASIGGILLLRNTTGTLITAPDAFSVSAFLSKALMIVMGVEFVRMLTLHTARAAINVLLFAIARQMIVSHGGDPYKSRRRGRYFRYQKVSVCQRQPLGYRQPVSGRGARPWGLKKDLPDSLCFCQRFASLHLQGKTGALQNRILNNQSE